MTSDDRTTQLIEASSLGSVAARRLRQRTTPEQVAKVRAITRLRNEVAHGGTSAWLELGAQLEEAGDLTGAELSYRKAAAAALIALAELYERRGEGDAAANWAARAQTLVNRPSSITAEYESDRTP